MPKSKNKYSMGYKDRGAGALFRISHFFYRHRFLTLSKLVKYLNTFVFRCFIPASVNIGVRLDLPHGGFGVVMHEDVTIGDDAIIFHNVTIGNGGARIGDRVTIGAGAIIIGAVTIGDDVVVGAGTVVTKDIPNGSIVVGQAPRVILK